MVRVLASHSRVRVLAAIAAIACAPRGAPPREVEAPTPRAIIGCEAAERGGPGWTEQRVTDTPVAFCAPPDIRYDERSRKFAPPGPRPYPRSTDMPDWMEEWDRVSSERWALVAALYAAPNGWPILPVDVTELRQTVVAAAAGPAGPAIVRQYRIAGDAGRARRPPGEEGYRGFGLSPEKAELMVPLAPGRWLILAANLENPAERAELLRVLQSARRVDP
jgi:hypothetical protein